ncbi:hypothetical protein BDP81DRAFT_423368 [Colletotrichum phormii]|uniref:Uncharacterized protein n=1 Tax=Colletotrichum phormii TaxID=359342 RepID=A0AAI9ZVR8_9PEZI|nr:uncharacterized protein BDP81DRAFT_423368 [Colletotrichum phormii]KAK1639076.1 hypothetical protein BDP81DRAFT_423368 [Colletotrichum phormii]
MASSSYQLPAVEMRQATPSLPSSLHHELKNTTTQATLELKIVDNTIKHPKLNIASPFLIQSTTTPIAPTIRPCTDPPAKETCRVFLEAVNTATIRVCQVGEDEQPCAIDTASCATMPRNKDGIQGHCRRWTYAMLACEDESKHTAGRCCWRYHAISASQTMLQVWETYHCGAAACF